MLTFFVLLRDFLTNTLLSAISIVRLPVMSRWPKNKLFNLEGQQECILIGNGPSVSEALSKINDYRENKLLICVNHFPTTNYYEQLKPSVYITSAPDLWLDDIDEKFIKQSNYLFDQMAEKTNWPLQLFIPFESKQFGRWKKPLLKNQNISIHYYNNTPIEGWKWLNHFLFRENWGMPRPHNVMIPSIFLSINSGLKKIYLIGADHSWLPEISVTEDNQVLLHQKHFYDEATSKAQSLDKRGKGQRKLHEILHKFMLAFKGYFELKAYAESKGVKILNATPNSYIDAFERVRLY